MASLGPSESTDDIMQTKIKARFRLSMLILFHYTDVIMTTMRLKSPASRLFTQPFIQTQITENIKVPRHWPLCGEFTGTGEVPAQRASYAENVSIWWRHHGFLRLLNQSYSIESFLHNAPPHYMSLRITHAGLVTKIDAGSVISRCWVDISYFPFDTQTCDIIVSTFLFTCFL